VSSTFCVVTRCLQGRCNAASLATNGTIRRGKHFRSNGGCASLDQDPDDATAADRLFISTASNSERERETAAGATVFLSARLLPLLTDDDEVECGRHCGEGVYTERRQARSVQDARTHARAGLTLHYH